MRSWHPLRFADPVVGKNFYLFDAIAHAPDVRNRLTRDPALAALRIARLKQLAEAATSCGADIECHARAMTWSEGDIAAARAALVALASRDAVVARFVANDLRKSGVFYRHHSLGDAELLGRAWTDAAAALNRIIDVYAAGKPPLYPKIDSVSYDVKSDSYRRLIDVTVGVLAERRGHFTTFYDPTLALARRLLDINRRDEAGRFEPLHEGENAAAYRRIGRIDWSRFAYTVIVVPGAGPEQPDVHLDPWGKLRLEIAVAHYRAKRAPFILVSGGFVHPSQTRFNEALEMKRALIADFGVPAEAILIDPHARHTTTNLRNAARLILRYGIPPGRPALISTDQYQSAYIESADFRDRCARELGYQPVVLGKRLSRFDLAFTPAAVSLHADATDPLDP